MSQLNQLTAATLIQRLSRKEITPSEIIADTFKRIEEVEAKVKAFCLFDKEQIKARLKKIEQGGRLGKLFGIPVLIKDNICVNGELTTCASKILSGFKPPYHATVVERLEKEGAILFGKANMDEFAFGSSCETSCYGPTHNPWDLERIPGGSSGGSAAAVCADETILALGSDTGGSIRQPASLCGVVGLKPTYGRISRYGLIAFASSLDQIGPISKDVGDAALLMNMISGSDAMDSTCVDLPVPDYTKSLVNDVRKIKIGVPKEYFVAGIDKEVEAAVKKAIALLTKLGAQVNEISLPHTEYAVAVYYIIGPAEASSNLARFDGVQYGLRAGETKGLIEMYKETRREGFGQEAKRRNILGTFVLSSGYYDAYYLRALKVRTLIKRDFELALQNCDAILTPTSPTAAFKIGEKLDNPLAMYLSDVCTISANLAGIPAISLPCGFTKNNLPIGLQLLAKPFNEEMLLRIAYTYEQNTEWHLRKPEIT
jgi:aspartyl-tRNA(Asn)/glutamyl-tRNA(Gln) amidotransferase subunit A